MNCITTFLCRARSQFNKENTKIREVKTKIKKKISKINFYKLLKMQMLELLMGKPSWAIKQLDSFYEFRIFNGILCASCYILLDNIVK